MIEKNNKKVVIGIIPARGGSKGIHLKNIKPMNGKPLIEYSIESAIASNVLDIIVVSTDNDEIAIVSSKYKDIEVQMRPSELAADTSTTESVLIYVCNEIMKKKNIDIDYVLTLEPTSPFRTEHTIRKCVELLRNTSIDSVVGVTEFSSVLGSIEDNQFKHIFPNQPRRRQDRKPLYQESSTIYGTLFDILKKKKSVLGDKVCPLQISKEEAMDINDSFDFELAESVIKFRTKT